MYVCKYACVYVCMCVGVCVYVKVRVRESEKGQLYLNQFKLRQITLLTKLQEVKFRRFNLRGSFLFQYRFLL